MVTEAQKRASRLYESMNRDKTNEKIYRRTAKMFIKNHANLHELDELKELIIAREKFLKGKK